MQKCLSKTKNTQKNKELVQVIESDLVDLDNEIKNMSENVKKIEKLYAI